MNARDFKTVADNGPPPSSPVNSDTGASSQGSNAAVSTENGSSVSLPPLTNSLKKKSFEDFVVGYENLRDSPPSIAVADGTLTINFGEACGTLAVGDYPVGDTKHLIADALVNAYGDYPYAQQYEYYCGKDANGESLKGTLDASAIKGAVIGRGDSGKIHVNIDAAADAVVLLRDGLPADE